MTEEESVHTPNVIEASEYDWCDRTNPRYARISKYLGRGVLVADSIFDKIYPADVVRNSEIHWSPVKVAAAAAKLLCDGAARRVLDVGSGSGKLCLVGSLTTAGMFTGVERRKYLVEISRETAIRMNSTAKFIHGDVFGVDWSSYDSIYFYNPFYELRLPDLGQNKELDRKRESQFFAYVSETMSRLSKLRVETRVVTYHGFGGELPPSYSLVKRVSAGSGYLNLWIKRF